MSAISQFLTLYTIFTSSRMSGRKPGAFREFRHLPSFLNHALFFSTLWLKRDQFLALIREIRARTLWTPCRRECDRIRWVGITLCGIYIFVVVLNTVFLRGIRISEWNARAYVNSSARFTRVMAFTEPESGQELGGWDYALAIVQLPIQLASNLTMICDLSVQVLTIA